MMGKFYHLLLLGLYKIFEVVVEKFLIMCDLNRHIQSTHINEWK